MNFYIALLSLLLVTLTSNAQKQLDNWCFGIHNGLSFVSGSPTVLPSNSISTNEGCASMSSSNGDLLFYTDGRKVYSKFHTQMVNGSGLNGGYSSSQSALIVPDPADTNQYYIFTSAEMGGLNGICYSKVNMTLQSGVGAVTLKNIQLLSPAHEKLTAVKQSNGAGYWVIAHDLDSTTTSYYAYPVTISGVGNPIISNVGTLNTGQGSWAGCMKVSPDGTKLVNPLTLMNMVEICDFDASTGIVSNPFLFNSGPGDDVYGCEFSSSSNVLYLATESNPYKLFQLNLNAGSIALIISSATLISSTAYEGGSLQLASDNKIYLAHHNSMYLGVINNPDSLGIACNYTDTAIAFPNTVTYGLQNAISSFNQNTALIDSPMGYLNFKIYPIPFENILNISFGNNEIAEFKLFDLASRTVMSMSFFNNHTVLTDHLAKGLYLYEVSNGTGIIRKGKLIKQ